MPRAWSAKDERQYGHILSSCLRGGRGRSTCARITGATVNKTRRRQGRLAGFFGPCAHNELMREIRSGLNAPEHMMTRGYKDGNNAWVDIYPRTGPAMRITHSIGGNMRNPPTFAGLGMFGAAEAKAKKNVRCISLGKGKLWCWNKDFTGNVMAPSQYGQFRVTQIRRAATQLTLDLERAERGEITPKIAVKRNRDFFNRLIKIQQAAGLIPTPSPTSGVAGVDCRKVDADTVYCWDDTSGRPGGGLFIPKR